MALNVKTLGIRALTAFVFVTVLMTCLRWNYYSFSVFFFVIALMGLNEFFKLSKNFNTEAYRFSGYLGACLIYLSFVDSTFLFNLEIDLRSLCFLVPGLILTEALFNQKTTPIQNTLFTLFGIVYAVIPFALLHQVVLTNGVGANSSDFNPDILVGVILLIWCNDTFAYLGGSLFGKHKMIERISPGKTWEGTVFGILCTFAGSFYIASFFDSSMKNYWMFFGLLVPVMATIGDLAESMIKRQANVKDTGNLMPGHGGILDRFDSLIFVAPMVFVILKLI